jgi:hypothetical protein
VPDLTAIARRMMGVPYRTALSVDVTAPRPKFDVPTPPNMDQISLGSGLVKEPGRSIKLNPNPKYPEATRAYKNALEVLLARYPGLRQFGAEINIAPQSNNIGGAFNGGLNRRIAVTPDIDTQSKEGTAALLGHELSHAGDYANMQDNWFKTIGANEPIGTPYLERSEEVKAFGTGSDIYNSLIKGLGKPRFR